MISARRRVSEDQTTVLNWSKKKEITILALSDITAYMNNLERILDNLKEGIIAHDLNRRIFYFNREAEKITGFSKDEVIGNDCHKALGGPFCGDRCHFCKDAGGLDDTEEYTLNITTKQGESRRIEMIVSPILDDTGTMRGVLAAFRDITDWLKLKMRAKKLNSFAEIIGQDVKMLQIFQQISDVAGYDYPVHISGETGIR